jgi:hypothetical protein
MYSINGGCDLVIEVTAVEGKISFNFITSRKPLPPRGLFISSMTPKQLYNTWHHLPSQARMPPR